MPHNLVSARPGKPGGSRSGKLGQYVCACGEIYPGNESFKIHRQTALHAEAVERGAKALADEIQYVGAWDLLDDFTRDVLRRMTTMVLQAAKPTRRGKGKGWT